MNIPIFRAKKIDSDDYVEGDLFNEQYIISKSDFNNYILESINHIRNDVLTKDCIQEECKNEHMLLEKMLNKLLVNERLEHIFEIDPTTLSIHFESMIDIEGDKIFASLEEFGKGGDIVTDGEYDFVVIFNDRSFDLMFVEDNTFAKFNEWDDWNKFTKKGVQR